MNTMRTKIISLKIAGAVCILFTAFHCMFQKMFQWDTALNCMTPSDRAILLTYHYISILIVGYMAFISLFQSRQLIESKVKSSILTFFNLFFCVRIVTEFTLFGFHGFVSSIILIMCLIPIVLFTIPILNKQ
jgi:hypothetical protein